MRARVGRMIETELKITLDAAGEARLRPASSACRAARGAAPRHPAALGLLRHARPRPRRGRDRAAAAQGRPALGADGEAPRQGGRDGGLLTRTWRSSGRRRAGGWRSTVPTRRASTPRSPRRPAARRSSRSSRRGCGAPPSGWRRPAAATVELAIDSGEIVAGDARAADPRGRARAGRGRGRRDLPSSRGGSFPRARCGSPPPTSRSAATGWRAARRPSAAAPRRPGRPPTRRTRRSRRWPATSCATAWRRSPPTWRWWPRARTSRDRTSCASGCGGCAPRFAIFAPSLGEAALAAARRTRPRAARARGGHGCATSTC